MKRVCVNLKKERNKRKKAKENAVEMTLDNAKEALKEFKSTIEYNNMLDNYGIRYASFFMDELKIEQNS